MKRLMCTVLGAITVFGGAFAEGTVCNLTDFLNADGPGPVYDYVEGGSASPQYLRTYGPDRAFDGVTSSSDQQLRWLGSIVNDTYLKIGLPSGHTCSAAAYRIHKLTSGHPLAERHPTAWRFYGITAANEEVLLDEWTGIAAARLDEAFPVTAPVGKFVAFKWVPTDSAVRGKETWDVGLMEFEISITNLTRNIRDLLGEKGYDVQTYVGGMASADTLPAKNAFNGVTAGSDIAQRWLGSIAGGTYLQLILPDGCSCEIDSYTLWPLTTGNDAAARFPTAWRFYGLTANGDEMLLSEREGFARGVLDCVKIDDLNAGTTRFVGFKWVPTKSNLMGNAWDVGLMELEIVARNLDVDPTKRCNLRDLLIGQGFDVGALVSGGTAGVHYADTFGPGRAFDGVSVTSDFAWRWLGEMKNGTFLAFMLPENHSCRIEAFRMCRLSSGPDIEARTPTGFDFYGITRTGAEELLSRKTEQKELRDTGSQVVEVEVASNKRYVGFKWVPTNSAAFQKIAWSAPNPPGQYAHDVAVHKATLMACGML